MRAASGNVFWMYGTENATRDPTRYQALRSYYGTINQTTAADVQALAQRFLRSDAAVPVLVLPKDGAVPTLSFGGPTSSTAVAAR
jgi:hypothetical protein